VGQSVHRSPGRAPDTISLTVASRRERPFRWLGYRLAYRRLFPLWLLLHDATRSAAPQRAALAGLRDRFVVRDMETRLNRRYADIADALLLVKPDRDTGAIALATAYAARQRPPDRLWESTVRAATIVISIAAIVDLTAAGNPGARLQPRLNAPHLSGGPRDVTTREADIAFWCQTADALRSPLVRRIRRDMRTRRRLPR
jgi:Family of unknown function (DUF6545)